MQHIKWGIIGCGNVTEQKSGPAFSKVPHSTLVAVMRRNAAKAKDYAERHQVAKWYSDATELINDAEINAIYIATPPSSHEEYAIQALAAGKFVYVEKPMSLDVASAQRMADAVDSYQGKLVVAHYRRAQPMFLKIKDLLDEGSIGKVNLVQLKMYKPSSKTPKEENWRVDPAISGGGIFHDLAPHQLDLMYFFFGRVASASGIAIQQEEASGADDLVCGQLIFENGIVFNGSWCFTINPYESADLCEIYGSKGKISFAIFGYHIEVTLNGETERFDFMPLEHVQQPMIEQVVQYFLGKGENPCPVEDGLLNMQLMTNFTARTSS
ncbi:MAG: Gfo/Idh/MocA family oxidoreductase [Pedobacter sp.]|nr:Gfo/Idh/MocA family oxidoreductase [Pedobacter sp.]MDQ8051872.1 Gfo/Idh/MocA family oxidoreductase [Pedobacter sp.]